MVPLIESEGGKGGNGGAVVVALRLEFVGAVVSLLLVLLLLLLLLLLLGVLFGRDIAGPEIAGPEIAGLMRGMVKTGFPASVGAFGRPKDCCVEVCCPCAAWSANRDFCMTLFTPETAKCD